MVTSLAAPKKVKPTLGRFEKHFDHESIQYCALSNGCTDQKIFNAEKGFSSCRYRVTSTGVLLLRP